MSSDSPSFTVGVPKETFPGEGRVALIPAVIASITNVGASVLVEPGAGRAAGIADSDYVDAGATLVEERKELFSAADVILQVRTAGANLESYQADIELLHAGQFMIGMCDPLGQPRVMAELADRQVTSLALELLPRTTRAQSMDVLSSMASIAGYKSVVLAAEHLPRIFPMMMTAAGTITPARVLVVGAGVAGLQAIATARRLGAVVYAYDIRPAVKEEVLSLGARFVELDLETGEDGQSGGYAKQMDEDFYRRQRELMAQVVAESNVVITTAAVPGKKAPVLVTGEMVAGMSAGSVIVDLAAETGGNCELTTANDVTVEHGVTIVGCVNLPATVPFHASQMYSKNISTFLLHLVKDGVIHLDTDDEITNATLVTRDGEVVQPSVRELLGLAAPAQADAAVEEPDKNGTEAAATDQGEVSGDDSRQTGNGPDGDE